MVARSLVIVLDGLRPDYVEPDLMPNLCALRDRGITSRQHHAVFPSETRVQAASLATGCYPDAHGLVGNSLWLPDLSPDPIDTGDADQLLRANREAGEGVLTARSLGEVLASRDRSLFVAGSSSTGASLLVNHERTGAGVVNARGLVAPESLADEVERSIGPPPKRAVPNVDQNRWAFDAYLAVALDRASPPEVSVLWISDPDLTMHRHGVGHPRVLEAVEHLDEELGRVFDGLRSRNALETTNVFVLADHGFSTDGGDLDVSGIVEERGFEDEVTVVADSQLFVDGEDGRSLGRLVRALQRDEDVGAIFARRRAGFGEDGRIQGTIPLDAVRLDHDRAADLVVAPDWSDRENDRGYPGATTRPGVGGHGTLSPYEMCVHLIAAGPDLKRSGRRSRVPTGHVDLAPTLVHLQGVRPPASMQGRVLHELLRDGPEPGSLTPSYDAYRASAPDDVRYEASLERAHAEGATYPAVARVDRAPDG